MLTIKQLTNELKKLENKLNKELEKTVKESSKKIRNEIVKDTLTGKDVKGTPFHPYSPNYAKLKHKTKVNLKDTGDMLDDFKSRKISKYRYFVGFSKLHNALKASGHQQGQKRNKLPVRQFLGVSKKHRRIIDKIIKRRLKKLK